MPTVSSLVRAKGGYGDPGRTPYFIEKEIDLAAAATAKGSALATNDVIQCLTIGSNQLIMAAGWEVITAPAGGTACTGDLGITGGDVDAFVDGGTITGASAGAVTQPAAGTPAATAGADDTIDLLLLGTTPDTSGVLRVWALVYDVDGVGGNKEAAEVDRDQLA